MGNESMKELFDVWFKGCAYDFDISFLLSFFKETSLPWRAESLPSHV